MQRMRKKQLITKNRSTHGPVKISTAVDESFQPTAVGFAEALNNKDKPEDAVLDVQGIATVTPAIVQACTQDKQANFKDKVKGEWDKIKKDM